MHIDPKDLQQKLDRARELVTVGALYRHRSGGLLYRVDLLVLREEDLEPAVIYSAVDGAPIPWDRKVSIFLERFHRVELPASVPSTPRED